jgi:8-oxo-dGTP pyrophosphatase MutT (NUDIX family)
VDAEHPIADEPDQVQRVGAYAVCVDDGRILLTRLTDTDLWTLPGGGVDHGEDVRTAAIREVYEETGLPLTIGDLLEVDSVHFTGRSPSGRLEDFHAIRVIFAGTVPTDVEPHVVEVDGSTAEVAWVQLADLAGLHVAALVRVALALHP